MVQKESKYRFWKRWLVLYNLNRLVFFGVFALCRIVTIPRFWLTVYNQSEAISNTSPDLIGILFVSGAVLGKIIGDYWRIIIGSFQNRFFKQ